jgi:hypothetical protein
MTDDSLAFKIARSGAPHMDINDAAAAVESLTRLGYEFVPPGVEGRYLVEHAEGERAMAEYLRQNTHLAWRTAHEVLREIGRLGLRIREPDQHPSGYRTQEAAISNVQPFGAKLTAAQRPIDSRGPGNWKTYG